MVIKYRDIPPQIYVSKVREFYKNNPPPGGFRHQVRWERVVSSEERELEQQQMGKRIKIFSNATVSPVLTFYSSGT